MKKLLFFFLLSSLFVHAQKSDSLFSALRDHPQEDAQKVNIYIALSAEFLNYDPGKAKEYAGKGKDLASRLGDDKGLAESSLSYAQACAHTGEYETALQHLESAEKLFRKINEPEGLLRCTIRLSTITSSMGDYRNGLRYALAALKMAGQSGDKKRIATTYTNIGNIYYQTGNKEHALEYTLRGLKVSDEIGDQTLSASLNNNLGAIYLDMKDYRNALECYQKALAYADKRNDRFRQSAINYGMGQVHFQKGDYDKAIAHLKKSYSVDEEIGNKGHKAQTLFALGDCYRQKKQADNAIRHYLDAYAIGDAAVRGNAAAELAELYKTTGNKKSAEEFEAVTKKFNDSIAGQSKKMAELQAQYEMQKKSDEIAKKNDLLKQAEAEVTRQRSLSMGMIALIVGAIVVGLGLLVLLIVKMSK